MTAQDNATESKPLHILQMGTQFGMGGITRHILSLSDWLRERDHIVTLAGTSDIWANAESQSSFVDLPTRYVAADGGNMLNRLRQTFISARRLRRYLKDHPVDLIHAHESAPALVANFARRGLGIPLAVTYHGSEPERIAAFGKISKRADLIITPSNRSGEDLKTIGGVPKEKLKVIGLGVPPAPTYRRDEIARLRKELLGDGTHLVVTIARILHQKGIDILIDTVDRVRDTNPDIRFVLCGDGPDEAKMKALAQAKGLGKYLTFVGRTEQPHLYLQAADLFLLTSRWEALPFTIAEAFRSGTPAVAAACSGVVELIDDEVGAVVEIGAVDDFAQTILKILKDETRRRKMATNAFERSKLDRFDPDWVHNQFLLTYQDLVMTS